MLQIRRGNWDNLEIIYHFFRKRIFSDPSLELSRRDGSNEESQHMFLLRDKKKYLRPGIVTCLLLTTVNCASVKPL